MTITKCSFHLQRMVSFEQSWHEAGKIKDGYNRTDTRCLEASNYVVGQHKIKSLKP